ncbi:XRE family transcriptional regulator [Colidextribacter sp. OB.20]|uniref:helix-turn-helix domain-containing protein n=1 Tax=Colidextribacter sp. OB.20 TaxID=2304568 RepID=UPI00136EB391|nr:helix-turn-helix transcriptional regulator [Colidextribacter sp. OB.20]NBI09013.1 XRE family transcriptional regulator [Colidextribacter sp. OB.20]
MLKLSERLRSLRKERGLTQTEAANAVEISLKSYCRYESGEREPTASVLVQIADFYSVSADYLLGRSEERT